ncbi:MAG: hypothetical protein BGO43_09795 [Gammaproteobacteria bacterium 39-13]|nr:phosphotransferase [Gammaproteobacteria bacterium]OJV93930.1 MAG: hypothetical protein BGO43_09795 [Gammaproteobacteria bacterium 39-13]
MHNTALAIAWAERSLIEHGYNINSPLEPVREMPWSSVSRFSTSQGFVYFKQMAEPFAIEPVLLRFLEKKLLAKVPHVIDMERSFLCFLMKGSGTTLRNILKADYQTDLVSKTLKMYAKIQLDVIKHADELLTLGVPDWRLAKLPELYLELISQRDLLRCDGLIDTEITTLQHLYPKFCELCTQLAAYKIPETIEHGDFHDNNILLEDQDVFINDWGDATISHPFFSLASWLNSAERNHALKATDPRTLMLQNAYLTIWQEYAPLDKLIEILSVVKKIRHFQFALNFRRVNECQGMDKLKQFHGYMADALRDFIAIF